MINDRRAQILRVLLIEDDTATVESIRLCLEVHQSGSDVISTAKGFEGVGLAKNEIFDVVILDLGLPDIDGMIALEELKRFSNAPILIVSARHTPEVIAKALEIGADDYILKPFAHRHFLSRLENVIRCSRSPKPQYGERRVSRRGLVIDLDTHQVTVNSNPVELTTIEWRVLSQLVERGGRIVPLTMLAKEVWNSDSTDVLLIESTISQLRIKLGDDPYTPSIIISEYRVGYRFLKEEQQ